MMNKHGVTAYLSAHEHSLQLLYDDNQKLQIISGSAGKLTPVTHGSDTIFAHRAFGFVRLEVTDAEFWMEFFCVDVATGRARSTGLFTVRHQ